MASVFPKSQKIKKALLLWAAASFICMLLIFLAASQAGDASGKVSDGLTRLIFGTVWRWLVLWLFCWFIGAKKRKKLVETVDTKEPAG